MSNRRALPREYAPGAIAPVSGRYDQRNVLGSMTGVRITVVKGQTLPPAPRGFTWSVVDASPDRETAA